MAERCLLHQSKIELLKWWLCSNGYELQDTKGFYEVLRARKGKETVIIFRQSDKHEHFTVQQKDYRLIRQFVKETKAGREKDDGRT